MEVTMKEIRGYCLIALLLLLLMPLGAQFAGGLGTINDPWLVATAGHLNLVRNYLNNFNHYFKQVADIDLGVDPYNSGQGWIPIGSYSNSSFRGSYDGDGFLISGLYINRGSTPHQGLFGYAYGARISNVQIVNANVTGSYAVGALLGLGKESTVVTGCSSSGMVTGNQYSVGGLIGTLEWWSSMSGCHSSAYVTGMDSTVGGLLGNCYYVSLISYCSSSGAVNCPGPNSYSSVGGMIGGSGYTSIRYSHSSSDVTALTNSSVGGFIGSVSGSNLIEECYADGDVIAKNQSGGFVGYNYQGSTIHMCYSSGSVTGVEMYAGYCGGFVGTNQGGGEGAAIIYRCYSTGPANAHQGTGGFVGRNVRGQINKCFATGGASGYSRVGSFCGQSLSNSEIYDCYASGNVSAHELSGGFIGSNEDPSLLARCYNYGPAIFSGTYYVGGFCGIGTASLATDCYWNTQTTNISTSACGSGRTTAEMTWPYDPNCYQNFNFDSVWGQDQGYSFNNGYPYLRWRYLIPPGELIIFHSGNSVNLSWNGVSGAASYKVYYSLLPDAADNDWILLGTTTALEYSTVPEQRMFFRVIASSVVP